MLSFLPASTSAAQASPIETAVRGAAERVFQLLADREGYKDYLGATRLADAARLQTQWAEIIAVMRELPAPCAASAQACGCLNAWHRNTLAQRTASVLMVSLNDAYCGIIGHAGQAPAVRLAIAAELAKIDAPAPNGRGVSPAAGRDLSEFRERADAAARQVLDCVRGRESLRDAFTPPADGAARETWGEIISAMYDQARPALPASVSDDAQRHITNWHVNTVAARTAAVIAGSIHAQLGGVLNRSTAAEREALVKQIAAAIDTAITGRRGAGGD